MCVKKKETNKERKSTLLLWEEERKKIVLIYDQGKGGEKKEEEDLQAFWRDSVYGVGNRPSLKPPTRMHFFFEGNGGCCGCGFDNNKGGGDGDGGIVDSKATKFWWYWKIEPSRVPYGEMIGGGSGVLLMLLVTTMVHFFYYIYQKNISPAPGARGKNKRQADEIEILINTALQLFTNYWWFQCMPDPTITSTLLSKAKQVVWK